MKKLIEILSIIGTIFIMFFVSIVQWWPFMAVAGLIAAIAYVINPVMCYCFITPIILLLICKVGVHIYDMFTNKTCI